METKQIERLKELTSKLVKLLDDPQQGLSTWQNAFWEILIELGEKRGWTSIMLEQPPLDMDVLVFTWDGESGNIDIGHLISSPEDQYIFDGANWTGPTHTVEQWMFLPKKPQE